MGLEAGLSGCGAGGGDPVGPMPPPAAGGVVSWVPPGGWGAWSPMGPPPPLPRLNPHL